ncbi:MAG TPA: glutathione S-transferase N-terminal domain-containing protein [Acetobacteraceae bacterium]|jgi:glutathione S-transferase|nr:glutathione S-transferase N-terminal domain-containing protein [Acetobacteraceae bacterium]
MALIFHERVGLDGRRISPFSWRIRYALAHKGLQPTVVPARFADVDRIRTLSGQHFVPIIEHDEKVVHDSWTIACYLETRFPDAPSLFGGSAGRGVARLVNIWSDMVLGPAVRQQIYGDFIKCIDPGDRAYFRSSREAQLGMTLEQYSADRDAALPGLLAVSAPLERTLSEQPFLAGEVPAYVDYVIFSVFQWARIGSPRDVLPAGAGVDALRDWRTRMVALYDNLGDRFSGYPMEVT